MDYYIVGFRIYEEMRYCVWYTDNDDGFLVNDGRLLWYPSEPQMRLYCMLCGITASEEEAYVYDLDWLSSWCSGSESEFNCRVLLSYWNIISDALHSLDIPFLGDSEQMTGVYEKLYHSCNLEQKRKPENTAEWSQEEMYSIVEVLEEFVEIFGE